MKLIRAIPPFSLLLATIGSMMGSGWLFSAFYAAKLAGPAAIISWLIGAFLMLLIVLTFTELATTFHVAGSMVRFAQWSHGPIVGFNIGLLIWLSNVGAPPIEAMAILQYASNFIPGIVEHSSSGYVLTSLGITTAAGLMLILVWLNWFGAKFFGQLASVVVLIKIAVPLMVLGVLLTQQFHAENFVNYGGFAPFGWQGILVALPIGGVIFSFMGYNPAMQLAGEAKRPYLAIPLALIGANLLSLLIYVGLQIAFIGALDPGSIAHGWQNLQYKGDAGPFAGILENMGLMTMAFIVYADAIISPLGAALVFTGSTARISYAMSGNGFFPKLLQRLNKNSVPMFAMAFNFIVGFILLLPFPGWQKIVGFLVSTIVLAYGIGPVALITLRHHYPNIHRPFRLPYAVPLACGAFISANLITFWTGWQTVSRVMLALIIGNIFLLLLSTIKIATYKKYWRYSWWLLPYFTGMAILSYLGSFGNGLNFLKFGWDFLVIALFSLVIFYFAVQSSIRHPKIEQLQDFMAELDTE